MQKDVTLILVLIFFVKASTSQNIAITYYNEKWEQTLDSTHAKYFRIAEKEDSVWKVKDFYIDSVLQMTGVYTTNLFNVKNGHFVYYNKNGNIQTIANYKNNKPHGKWKSYYDSGKLFSEENYEDSLLSCTRKTHYKSGNLKSNEIFKKDKFEGKCEWFFKNGNIASREFYNSGELIKIEQWNEEGRKLKGDLKTKVFPEYKGGLNALRKFVNNNTNYPAKLREQNIQGKVIVKFMVDFNGKVSKAEIFIGVHPELDKEALRVVMQLHKFKPGKQHNLPVNVWYQIPVIFKLN